MMSIVFISCIMFSVTFLIIAMGLLYVYQDNLNEGWNFFISFLISSVILGFSGVSVLLFSDDLVAEKYDKIVMVDRPNLEKECGLYGTNHSAKCRLRWNDYKADSLAIAKRFNKIIEKE